MRRSLAVLSLALLLIPYAAAGQTAGRRLGPAPAEPTRSATVVPVAVNGDPAARFSLVVMGDGYTADELPKYRAQLDKHLNVLWSIEPFRSYRNYINVYSVEIASPESGITCDPEVREQRKTPIGTFFQDGCTNPNARGILAGPGQSPRVRPAGHPALRPDPRARQHRYLRRHRRRASRPPPAATRSAC